MNLRRRDFLGAAGLGALAPFVPVLNRRAEAAGGAFPKRLLLVFSGCGTLEDQFWPTGGETDFGFKPGSITEPLAPFKKKLLFPKNLHRITSGSGAHEKNMGGLWTCTGLVATNGYPRGPSLDQIIANALNPTTAFKSLQFGVQCESFNPGGNKPVLKSMTYSGSNAVLKPEDDPTAMFKKLMLPVGGAAPTPVGPTAGDLERVRARRQSVIDAVRGDLKTLSTRLDREDRQKLDQHLESLFAVEKRLQMPIAAPVAGAGCRQPEMKGTFADATARSDNANFPAILDVQNKLAIAALACDRTRVATVQWSRAFSGVRHNWVGVSEDHHTISHRTGANDISMLHKINRWYGERLAEVLAQLDAVKEGDGTLLDNTVLVWGNEAATGNHNPNPGVTLLAGGGGGSLRTGRFVDCSGNDWSQLLITVAHAVGATGVNKIGDLGMKDGNIASLLA
jgi:hypothetical protein